MTVAAAPEEEEGVLIVETEAAKRSPYSRSAWGVGSAVDLVRIG